MKHQELEKTKEYKYGFVTDIESVKAPKGLNEEVIKFISKIKKEPKLIIKIYIIIQLLRAQKINLRV